MKTTRILMTAAVAMIMAAPAFANEDMANKMDGHGGMWAAMDTNNDGKVTKDEWNAAHEKKFTETDANNDGVISKDEWVAKGKEMRAKYTKHKGVKGSTSTPPANNEVAPSHETDGADGAGGATAQ
jgi:hypothetical protein